VERLAVRGLEAHAHIAWIGLSSLLLAPSRRQVEEAPLEQESQQAEEGIADDWDEQ
jgi:hypothetical protein